MFGFLFLWLLHELKQVCVCVYTIKASVFYIGSTSTPTPLWAGKTPTFVDASQGGVVSQVALNPWTSSLVTICTATLPTPPAFYILGMSGCDMLRTPDLWLGNYLCLPLQVYILNWRGFFLYKIIWSSFGKLIWFVHDINC